MLTEFVLTATAALCLTYQGQDMSFMMSQCAYRSVPLSLERGLAIMQTAPKSENILARSRTDPDPDLVDPDLLILGTCSILCVILSLLSVRFEAPAKFRGQSSKTQMKVRVCDSTFYRFSNFFNL